MLLTQNTLQFPYRWTLPKIKIDFESSCCKSFRCLPFQELLFQELPFQELPFQELAFQELAFQELAFQELPFQELPFQEPPLQEPPLQELRYQGSEVQGLEVQGLEVQGLKLREDLKRNVDDVGERRKDRLCRGARFIQLLSGLDMSSKERFCYPSWLNEVDTGRLLREAEPNWRKKPDDNDAPAKSYTFTGQRTYTIGAKVGTEHVDAFPDTGAKVNMISAPLAQKLSLKPRAHTKRPFQLPTGGHVMSPGCTQVPFSFRDEETVRKLECYILPQSAHGLILSDSFLHSTETLTKYRSRIAAAVRPGSNQLGLRLLGNERRYIHGLIDGQPIRALPDTGSDVMVMSEAYALSRGFDIDRNLEHFLDLELADGSEVFTCGLVRGLEWTFSASRRSVKCDFYILEDLCTDVVLNSDFLFDLDVFSKESESLFEFSYSEDLSELLLISLKGNRPAELPQHEDVASIDREFEYSSFANILARQCIVDLQISLVVTSADAFSRQRVLAELHYRDEVDDLIDALDSDDQEAARRTELERRRVWEELRQRHQQLQVAARLNVITSPRAAPTQDTNTATSKRRRWAFRFRIPSLRASRKGG